MNDKELLKRMMKNPDAYLARFSNIENARKFQNKTKGGFIVKVKNQFWVACGRYAGILKQAGFEYVR